MRRPGQGASTGPRPGQRGSKSDTRLSAVSTARPGSTPAAVTIEPYECPDTALGSRHTGSVARWPGSARLCRGRIRGRQRAEGMNQRVPHPPPAGPGQTRAGVTGSRGLSLVATLAAAGAATQRTRGQRSLIRGGCHRPRQEARAEQPPVTRGRAPWPSLATRLGLTRPRSSLAVSGVNGPGPGPDGVIIVIMRHSLSQ